MSASVNKEPLNGSYTSVLEGHRDATRKVLRTALRGETQVALLDVPRHSNFGDHLIYLAELEYLKQLRVDVRLRANMFGPVGRELKSLHPDGPILLQAGATSVISGTTSSNGVRISSVLTRTDA